MAFSLLTEDDLYLFNQGSHFRLFEKLGAHLIDAEGAPGAYFAVWAPNAQAVSVFGDFDDWDKQAHPLVTRGASGIWEGFVPGVAPAARYKYHVRSQHNGYAVDKADPCASYAETAPRTASMVWDRTYAWGDSDWMRRRAKRNGHKAPMAIYELHVGSWGKPPELGGRPATYRDLAAPLASYVREMGFTHVELMPVMEHPFSGSWGYQITGYMAPTSRYGTPQDLMYLVDYLHQHGIGVILDWVPAHFPSDEHGLAYFDGTHLYEHADPKQGFHPDWRSCIFNYSRNEVRSFLISSAMLWLEKYHVDGLRVDGVASMLYLDYSRKDGEWVPNEHGGRENLGALAFLRRLNEEVYRAHPDVQTFAEESTSWPMVSRPTYVGGLGFGMKWDMGWMHDTLQYMARDPIFRRYHQDEITFRMIYAFSENFVLALSHDEVVHGKGSLFDRMPGEEWQKMANLRLLLGYMYALPGKKLLFMGDEFGQRREWDYLGTLQWDVVRHPPHRGLQSWVKDLNRVLCAEAALHELDFYPAGFQWVDASDAPHSVLSFLRKGSHPGDALLAVFNFTPVPRHGYRVGAPRSGRWLEVLNSDAKDYGGSGQGNLGGVKAAPDPYHGQPNSVVLTLPPLGMVLLKSLGG